MRSRKRLSIKHLPFFVTINTHQRRRIFADYRWAKLLQNIFWHKKNYLKYTLKAYVIMPDHYHAIIKPPTKYRIGDVIRHINGSFAREYNLSSKKHGQVFQRDFYDHIIRNDKDMIIKIEYILNNPRRAGLVENYKHYRYLFAYHLRRKQDFRLRGSHIHPARSRKSMW
ncbi:MAG: transposase [Patescibacteria group bacterium]